MKHVHMRTKYKYIYLHTIFCLQNKWLGSATCLYLCPLSPAWGWSTGCFGHSDRKKVIVLPFVNVLTLTFLSTTTLRSKCIWDLNVCWFNLVLEELPLVIMQSYYQGCLIWRWDTVNLEDTLNCLPEPSGRVEQHILSCVKILTFYEVRDIEQR